MESNKVGVLLFVLPFIGCESQKATSSRWMVSLAAAELPSIFQKHFTSSPKRSFQSMSGGMDLFRCLLIRKVKQRSECTFSALSPSLSINITDAFHHSFYTPHETCYDQYSITPYYIQSCKLVNATQ